MTDAYTCLHQSELTSLPLLHRGKVRDVYALGADELLIVASDRLSAFDVVLPDPIPGKGEILTDLSNYWFAQTAAVCPNHLSAHPLLDALPPEADPQLYLRRSVRALRLRALPVEAIVRGYLIGSGWKEYQATGSVCGIALPEGLPMAAQLPQAIFTPSTKAAMGDHDVNISFAQTAQLIGAELAAQVRDASLRIYAYAAAHAAARGVIIADTKLEFGLDAAGQLCVMDEMLTPDSSRFWPADQWAPGHNPPSYDKQFVRDYLETLNWNKQAPGPRIPAGVISGTQARYREALQRLTGPRLQP
jgi:phosphoribosylaminoimidazole-succinocarboxamide synthase